MVQKPRCMRKRPAARPASSSGAAGHHPAPTRESQRFTAIPLKIQQNLTATFVVGPSVDEQDEQLDIVVIGPVDAVERTRARLTETGDLADAEPVLPDEDDPTHGSCWIRLVPVDRTQPRDQAARRGDPVGLFAALTTLLRPRPGGSSGPGRHRASGSGPGRDSSGPRQG